MLSVGSRQRPEVIAANQALRAEGLPTLSLFCQLSQPVWAGKASLDVPDGIVARIDPELDEIRYGNVDAGTSVSSINALTVHLSDNWKVKLMEDNQATITILQQGHSQKLRHTDRTQRISFRWLQEQFVNRQVELINVDTTLQAADILTKAFDSTPVWHHALELIGISPVVRREPAPPVSCTPRAPRPEKSAIRGGRSLRYATFSPSVSLLNSVVRRPHGWANQETLQKVAVSSGSPKKKMGAPTRVGSGVAVKLPSLEARVLKAP